MKKHPLILGVFFSFGIKIWIVISILIFSYKCDLIKKSYARVMHDDFFNKKTALDSGF